MFSGQMKTGGDILSETSGTPCPVISGKTPDKYVPNAHDIRIIAGEATLVITDDKSIGGLWAGIDNYDMCSGSEQECFEAMRSMISENIEEACETLIFNLGNNLYLLNIADCQNRGAYDEDGLFYMHLCEDKIGVFYPIIKTFIEKHSGRKAFGVTICFGGGTSIGLCYLVYRLKEDGFSYYVIGTTLPFAKKKENSWSERRGMSIDCFERFDCTPYIDKSKSIKKFFEEDIEIIFDAMKVKVIAMLSSSNEKEVGNVIPPEDAPTDKLDDLLLKDDLPYVKAPKYLKRLHYGQCRTFADIIKTLNTNHKYSTFEEILQDFGTVIENFRKRKGCDDVALLLITDTIKQHQAELFDEGHFDFDKFLMLLEEHFKDGQGTGIDTIYTKRTLCKLLLLSKTLNDICQYTDINSLQNDLEGIATYKYNISCGEMYMSDPYPVIGNWPINWFLSGLRNQWEQIISNGVLDNDLMEKRMFTDHENKLLVNGIEDVLKEDFQDQGPCHPEVFYPIVDGTAPVYVKDERSRTYLTACGEGKGPRSGHESYEMYLVKHVLSREVSIGNYDYANGVYIPKDHRKPIFADYYGRLRFANQEEKEFYISKQK